MPITVDMSEAELKRLAFDVIEGGFSIEEKSAIFTFLDGIRDKNSIFLDLVKEAEKDPSVERKIDTCIKNEMTEAVLEGRPAYKSMCIKAYTSFIGRLKGFREDTKPYDDLMGSIAFKAKRAYDAHKMRAYRIREDEVMKALFTKEHPDLNPKALDILVHQGGLKHTKADIEKVAGFIRALHFDLKAKKIRRRRRRDKSPSDKQTS